MMLSGLIFLWFAAISPSLAAGTDELIDYGDDVSFPMQYSEVSSNYPWLEHNTDHSKPVPEKYKDMVPQPLGDRQAFYKEFLQGCVEKFGKKRETLCPDRARSDCNDPAAASKYAKLHQGRLQKN